MTQDFIVNICFLLFGKKSISGVNSLTPDINFRCRNFLHWLQTCLFLVQCLNIQLDAGREVKKRPATYRRLDVNIAEANLQLNLRCGRIFMDVLPHPSYRPTYLLDNEIVGYTTYDFVQFNFWTIS